MKLGIIGSGKIVHDFLTIADQISDIELTALATTKRSHQIGLDLQKKYQITKLYDNNADLFNDPDVDTVYVAVPNSLHFSISKEALEAGKNVICEKPFVATVDEARELKVIADQKKLIIIEAITNIYLENFKFIEENLDKIAPIHVVNLNYTQYSSRYDAFLAGDIQPAFDPKKDGGALMDLGIYNLHIIIKLFGKPESINYFPTMQKNIDTSGILHLSYSDKQASSIAAKDSFSPNVSTIEGEKGALIIYGHPNEIPKVGMQLKGQEVKVINNNKYSHRMVAEFIEFTKTIDQHKFKEADHAFVHSLNTLSVLQEAKSQR